MGSVPVSQWRLIAAALTVGTFLEGIAGCDPGGDRMIAEITVVVMASGDGVPAWILAAGPAGGAATYWALYRYYRNTDKSHAYERDTLIAAQPVQGNQEKVDHISQHPRLRHRRRQQPATTASASSGSADAGPCGSDALRHARHVEVGDPQRRRGGAGEVVVAPLAAEARHRRAWPRVKRLSRSIGLSFQRKLLTAPMISPSSTR